MQSVTLIESKVVDITPSGRDDQHALVALLTGITAGDRAALTTLYGRLQRPLYRYLLQLTPDRGVAEEILQDTFVAIWQSAATYQGRSSVWTWAFGVARRQAHNTLRRKGVDLSEDEDALSTIADPDTSVEDKALATADIEELSRHVQRLSPVLREVLALTFVQGLTNSEIAEILDVPEGTVKSRLNNARRMLREMMPR